MSPYWYCTSFPVKVVVVLGVDVGGVVWVPAAGGVVLGG
jgi:hypothetical protein